MSLFQIYWRALGYLAAERQRVVVICAANVALAVAMIAEPILFGRIIESIAEEKGVAAEVAAWAGLGAFNIVAFVLVARGADRLAHRRRAEVLTESFEKVVAMPLAWHHRHGTSQSLHTLLRAMETLFSLWLEFMRQHLSTAVALMLLIPTAMTLDWRMAAVLLALGAARGLPMVCANPDIVVQGPGGSLLYCAGALAERYEQLGGVVHYAGKPHPPIYAQAYEVLAGLMGGTPPKARILAIGDGVPTDLKGAAREGLDCLFISAGINEDGAALPAGLEPRWQAPALVW